MMMMTVISLGEQFEAGDAVAEIEAFYQTDLLKQMHRTIDRREVRIAFSEEPEYFFDGQRMRLPAKQV